MDLIDYRLRTVLENSPISEEDKTRIESHIVSISDTKRTLIVNVLVMNPVLVPLYLTLLTASREGIPNEDELLRIFESFETQHKDDEQFE